MKAEILYTCGRSAITHFSGNGPQHSPASYDLTAPAETFRDIYPFDIWISLLEGEEYISQEEYDQLPDEFLMYEELIELIWESPVARSLLRFVAEHGWAMTMETLEGTSYILDNEQKLLILNDHSLKRQSLTVSGYFRQSFLLSLLRGIRDIWHTECRKPHYQGLDLDSILILERVRMADCDMIAQFVAWELRSEGEPALWRHLIGSSEGDMAMAYANALEHNPLAAFNNGALVHSFRQWFEDEDRVDACDRVTLEQIDEELSNPACKKAYGLRRVSTKFIENMSRLPDQTFYLACYGERILTDPLFTTMNSDLNQAYYHQIARDLETVSIGAVAFRDHELAARIFPDEFPDA